MRERLLAWTAALLVPAAMASTCAAEPTPSQPDAARPRRPNILIIVADDMGFSDAGCYGGEIATPNLDRLSAGGLRFTQFYNTARCWPTRSCLLTGYYPQQIRMDPPHGRLPTWTLLLPHYLAPAGYRCYQSGKWHVTGAPKPCALGGFHHSYEMDDQNRYFSPQSLIEDDRRLPPVPRNSGYYATTAIADHAIRCLKEHAAKHRDRPFFEYLAFISPHFPLHALPEDIARYRDRYLAGWDAVRRERWQRLRAAGIVHCDLSRRDPGLAPRYFKPEFLTRLGPGEVDRALAWDELNDTQKRFQATKMAIHAAMVDRMDREIGRVLDQVRAMGAWDDTVVFFLSDNGADATILIRGDGHDPAAPPGSADSHLCLGPGWAAASNAPFRRHKIWVHEGGVSTPLIVHWPRGIAARGELRHDVGHAVDIVPTVLELTGISAAEVRRGLGGPPLSGKSLVPTLARDGSVQREFLYFHHEGNRALRQGDWKLVSAQENNDRWELYNLATDRCEMHDQAATEPDRARDMEALWRELDKRFNEQAKGP